MTSDREFELSPQEEKALRRLANLPAYHFSEEFRELMVRLTHLALDYGIEKVPLPFGSDDRPAFDDDAHRDRFVGAVHEGWKIAQNIILNGLLERSGVVAMLEQEENLAHREKRKEDKARTQRKIALIQREKIVLRRFLDGICWTVLDGQHHVIRRLHLDGRLPEVTPEQIRYIQPVLDQVNQNPLKMAIACDPTTFIHTFDILLMDREAGAVSFVEVKRGERNIELSALAQFAVESECDRFRHFATQGLEPGEVKHFERLARQAKRLSSIVGIINQGSGTDHRSGAAVQTPDPGIELDSFAALVIESCEEVGDDKSWSIQHIDDCLYLGVYSDRRFMFSFFGWVKGMGLSPEPTISLLDCYTNGLCRPLVSSYLPIEQIIRINSGAISVLMLLDIDRWIAEANRRFGNVFFLESKAKSKKVLAGDKGFTLINHKGHLVGLRTKDEGSYVGWGVLDRIYYDFQTPMSVAEVLVTSASRSRPTDGESPRKGDAT